jgi:hypothetical protein
VTVPKLEPVEVLVDDAAHDHVGDLLRRQMTAPQPQAGESELSGPQW